MSNSSTKTVAVVGAGPSGLVAAKEAISNNVTPTIFEKQNELGGVWNPKTGAVWEGMRTNISKFTTVFGDTPYSSCEMFPSSGSVFEYLNEYVDEFNLRNHIKFQTEVVSIDQCENSPNGSPGWNVTFRTSTGDLETRTYAGVIVASGIFAKSNIPSIPGLDSFPGKVLHSNEYKSSKDFKKLKVLTIGGSFSGAEIAADVSTQAKESYHSFQRQFWILRRYLPDSDRNGAKVPIDLLFYNRKFYSNSQHESEDEKIINAKKNKNLLSFCNDQQNFKPLKIPTDQFKMPINSVISDNYLPQVENGKLIPIHGSVKEIHGTNITFQDGTKLKDINAIIFGTGFQTDASFFPQRILNLLKYRPEDRLQPFILFQECVHPQLPGLFFVGMYKGPYFAVMEQQARWAARVLSGKVQLPPENVMTEGLAKEESIRDQNPRPQFPHPEYVLFADTVATFGRSFPNLDKLRSANHTLADALGDSLTRPPLGMMTILEHKKKEIATRFMVEPATPAHYNFIHSPKQVLNDMDFVQQVLKQFENI